MSYVGPRYGKDRMPRLAFVSLDPGRGRPDPQDRMAEAVRQRTVADDLASLPKTRHWYRTHEMAHLLLRPSGRVSSSIPRGSTSRTSTRANAATRRHTAAKRVRHCSGNAVASCPVSYASCALISS